MFAIAFDLIVERADTLHPRHNRGAYDDIGRGLRAHGFRRIQGSVYLGEDADLAAITLAMTNLRSLPWFADTVRDVRAFKVEDWSDITPSFKGDL